MRHFYWMELLACNMSSPWKSSVQEEMILDLFAFIVCEGIQECRTLRASFYVIL